MVARKKKKRSKKKKKKTFAVTIPSVVDSPEKATVQQKITNHKNSTQPPAPKTLNPIPENIMEKKGGGIFRIEIAKVIINSLALCIALGVYVETCNQVNITRDALASADSTGRVRDSIYIESVRYDNRAWVQVKALEKEAYNFDIISKRIYMVKLDMYNFGKTVARNVKICHYCVDSIGLIDTTILFNTTIANCEDVGTLGTGGMNTIRSRIDMSENDFYIKGKEIYFYGIITYEDIFNKKHFTKFCYKIIRQYMPVKGKPIQPFAIFGPTNIYSDAN